MELLKSLARGTQTCMCPYKGSARAGDDRPPRPTLANELLPIPAQPSITFATAGLPAAIAVAELKRIDAAPEIPTPRSRVSGFERPVLDWALARGTSRVLIYR